MPNCLESYICHLSLIYLQSNCTSFLTIPQILHCHSPNILFCLHVYVLSYILSPHFSSENSCSGSNMIPSVLSSQNPQGHRLLPHLFSHRTVYKPVIAFITLQYSYKFICLSVQLYSDRLLRDRNSEIFIMALPVSNIVPGIYQ